MSDTNRMETIETVDFLLVSPREPGINEDEYLKFPKTIFRMRQMSDQ